MVTFLEAFSGIGAGRYMVSALMLERFFTKVRVFVGR
jgi:hypothetical protein